MQIKLASYTALGSRMENEDSLAYEQVGPDLAYAVVCDGLGSHGGGQAASRTVTTQLKQMGFTRLPTEEQIVEWMKRSNQEILLKRDGPRHMKTTAVALFLSRSRAIWAHIGDSRLYHFHNGRLVDITSDHSVPYLEVKLGEIDRRDIPNHPDKNKVLKVLGEDTIAPEIFGPVSLPVGQHAFLLCSDGLWERLHEEEIMLDLHKALTPDQWLFNLRCRAEMRKSTGVDNNTAVAIFATVQ